MVIDTPPRLYGSPIGVPRHFGGIRLGSIFCLGLVRPELSQQYILC
jgi:hypothetical protein